MINKYDLVILICEVCVMALDNQLTTGDWHMTVDWETTYDRWFMIIIYDLWQQELWVMILIYGVQLTVSVSW